MKEKMVVLNVIRNHIDIGDLSYAIATHVNVVKRSGTSITLKCSKNSMGLTEIQDVVLESLKNVLSDDKRKVKDAALQHGVELSIKKLDRSIIQDLFDITQVGNKITISMEE